MNKKELLDSLRERGAPEKIVDVFEKVNRENFISYNLRKMAYEDAPIPLVKGQTTSQPYTIALMLSNLNLKPGQKVLEIGSGSGYVLALISELVGKTGKVIGLEIVPELVRKSRENLENERYKNVKVYKRNGSNGFPDEAKFDRILISAALRDVPEKIMAQLKTHGGILVAPKGSRFEQEIIVIERHSESEFEIKKRLPGFVFVPFVQD